MFSLHKNNNNAPICKIIGGKYDGEIVYMNNNFKENQNDNDNLYRDFNGLTLKNAKFELIIEPPTNQRTVIVSYGPSGAGKTYFLGNILDNIVKDKHKWNYNNILFFSKKLLEQENSFNNKIKKEMKQIDLNSDELLLNPLDLNNEQDKDLVKNSIVIFDDINTLSTASSQKKQLRKNILEFRDDLLEVSRYLKTTILLTEHISTNGQESKTILNESNIIVLFLGSGTGSYDRLLRHYLGLKTQQINKLLNMSSRYVIIIKRVPYVYITETEMGLLKNL